IVFHHAGWIRFYPAEAPWIKDWRLARAWLSSGPGPEAADEEAKKFADGVHQALVERKVDKEQLAVVGFDGRAQRALADQGVKTIDGWPLMLDATKTKTVDEISCLKMAFAITDASWYAAWEKLRPGARETDAKTKDWYRRLVERLDNVIGAIKPGATTRDAARHFAPASTWGYKDEAELLTLEIGHGIGLHAYGYPIINRQWSLDHP